MARNKRFAVKRSRKPAITFELEFETEDGKTDTESFTCVNELPAAALADFTRATVQNETLGLAAMIDMLSGLLIEGDDKRFLELIHSKDKIVDVETLSNIVEYVIEEFSERPTQPPLQSQRGQKAPTATSMAASS